MDLILIQILNGLASASTLFLVSVGLSLIFGVTRVVNFAHGSFAMLGAYLAVTLVGILGGSTSALGFWASVLFAVLIVAGIGAAIEMLLLRRIYASPELFQLLLTFGLVLIIGQLVLIIFGPEDQVGPRAPGLDGAVTLGGQRFPSYDLLLIGLGPLVLAALHLLLRHTRFGVLVRAATQDRDMVAALGVDQRWLFTAVFAIGCGLAALGGALQLPRDAIGHEMALQLIADAFVVTVVGGLGSIPGAFVAAILIGELRAFGIWLLPELTLVMTFLIMAVVLVARPHGLFGRAEGEGHVAPAAPLQPPGRGTRAGLAAVLVVLLLLPVGAGPYTLFLATEILGLMLFAASLHLMLGPAGMISFGHAAYFGLGAYGAGLLVTRLAVPMELALLAAPLVAGTGALLFGWFCVRLKGVYLAMLSLAFAQIVYALVFQWYGLTGGDNGVIGIWPSAWASSSLVYYYLALTLVLGALAILGRMVFAPFGLTLRAARDGRLRAEASGIDVARHQWLAFVIAGTFAGLAGGILAFHKGTIDPTWLSIPQSVDALVMVLLGGVQTLFGALPGAAAYYGLEIGFSTLTRHWPLILGTLIVAVVVALPDGLAGFTHRSHEARV